MNVLLNALYKEWLKTHDPYQASFEDFVWETGFCKAITYLGNNEWAIIG